MLPKKPFLASRFSGHHDTCIVPHLELQATQACAADLEASLPMEVC